MNLHINYKRNKKINLAHFDPSVFHSEFIERPDTPKKFLVF